MSRHLTVLLVETENASVHTAKVCESWTPKGVRFFTHRQRGGARILKFTDARRGTEKIAGRQLQTDGPLQVKMIAPYLF